MIGGTAKPKHDAIANHHQPQLNVRMKRSGMYFFCQLQVFPPTTKMNDGK